MSPVNGDTKVSSVPMPNAVNGSLRTPRHAFASEERRPNCGTPQRKRVDMRPKSVTAPLEQSLRKKQSHFFRKILPITPRFSRASKPGSIAEDLSRFSRPIGGCAVSTFGPYFSAFCALSHARTRPVTPIQVVPQSELLRYPRASASVCFTKSSPFHSASDWTTFLRSCSAFFAVRASVCRFTRSA
jgi:hypothetical protein